MNKQKLESSAAVFLSTLQLSIYCFIYIGHQSNICGCERLFQCLSFVVYLVHKVWSCSVARGGLEFQVSRDLLTSASQSVRAHNLYFHICGKYCYKKVIVVFSNILNTKTSQIRPNHQSTYGHLRPRDLACVLHFCPCSQE